MTRRIAILPDAVADQIAAGEVVERPASVVKELVENALDAGARQVRVTLENGGKTLIQVSDDGSGMGREDAVLALDRHATSKVRSAADLVGVATFGFRGEALPAIASVSRFALSTNDGETGTELSVTGGRLDRVADAVRQRGTTITVRALFFNTPARRKFLRSAASETRAAQEALATLALAHPDVGFLLEVDGDDAGCRCRPARRRRSAWPSVWGRELAGTLIPVEYAAGAFRLGGFVQRPGDAQPTGRRTQLFVNGRPFKDAFLVRAAEAGYRSAIHPGDRPSVFLRIEAAPAGRGRQRASRPSSRSGFAIGSAWSAWWRKASATRSARSWPRRRWETGGRSRPLPAGAGLPSAVIDELFAAAGDSTAPGRRRSRRRAGAARLPGAAAAAVRYLHPLRSPRGAGDRGPALRARAGAVRGGDGPAHRRRRARAAAAAAAHAGAHRRGARRRRAARASSSAAWASRSEAFGGRAVVLHAVPSPHPRFDAGACFRELVADLARGRFGGWANRLERFAATYACRAAVKGGARLDQREMRELLLRLFATDLPPHDVHGRSTIVQLPREELERRFGRR